MFVGYKHHIASTLHTPSPPPAPAHLTCALQHVYNFAAMLLPGGNKGKRQLDCAGVVTTTYAVCQRLAEGYGHADLAASSMQVRTNGCRG